jgi:hypothetical protein
MQLLYGVATAMPFLGIREIDAVLSYFVKSEKFLTSLAVKVCLNVAPEMITVLVLVIAGIAARDIRRTMKEAAPPLSISTSN